MVAPEMKEAGTGVGSGTARGTAIGAAGPILDVVPSSLHVVEIDISCVGRRNGDWGRTSIPWLDEAHQFDRPSSQQLDTDL